MGSDGKRADVAQQGSKAVPSRTLFELDCIRYKASATTHIARIEVIDLAELLVIDAATEVPRNEAPRESAFNTLDQFCRQGEGGNKLDRGSADAARMARGERRGDDDSQIEARKSAQNPDNRAADPLHFDIDQGERSARPLGLLHSFKCLGESSGNDSTCSPDIVDAYGFSGSIVAPTERIRAITRSNVFASSSS